jgi:hypothetical protein
MGTGFDGGSSMNKTEELLADIGNKLGWALIWLFCIAINTCGTTPPKAVQILDKDGAVVSFPMTNIEEPTNDGR